MSGYDPTLIPDDVLVRYLDGEAGPEETTRVDGAGQASPSAARLWELRHAGERFASVVAEVPVPELPPLRTTRSRRLPRAAAIVLLLAAGSAAALPPTRSLVLDAVDRARSWIADPAPLAAPGPSRTRVGITVDGPAYLIEVVGRQDAGVLRVIRGEEPELLAEAAGAELLVLPDRLRIVLDGTARDDVVVTVPPGVAGVRVRSGGEERLVAPDGAVGLTGER